MRDEDKNRDLLIKELVELRHRVDKLEASKTALKQEAKASREALDRFRRIVEATRDAIIMLDNDGRISFWNPAAEELFGYTAQEAMSQQLIIVIPERYRQDFQKGLKAFKKTGRGPQIGKLVESEGIKKEGAEFPVELSVSSVQIKGRWHAVAIARDITDRRRVEKVLRDSLEKYQLMLDNEKDVIMMFDLESSRFLEVNKAVEDLYGYTREEFLKLNVSDISADSEALQPCDNDLTDRAEGGTHFFFHKKKDGTVFPVEISACGFMWKNRKTFCAIVREITGRKKELGIETE